MSSIPLSSFTIPSLQVKSISTFPSNHPQTIHSSLLLRFTKLSSNSRGYPHIILSILLQFVAFIILFSSFSQIRHPQHTFSSLSYHPAIGSKSIYNHMCASPLPTYTSPANQIRCSRSQEKLLLLDSIIRIPTANPNLFIPNSTGRHKNQLTITE